MEKHLAHALDALLAGDHARALDALLAAWRAHRHPRVSALVDAVGALAPAAPVAGSDPVKAWKARAKAPNAADVGPLLASLLDGVKVADVGERVDRLGTLAPDPRVAWRYVAMLRAPPFTASSHKPVWVELFRQLTAVHRDPRALAAAAALAPDYTRVFGATVMGRWMQSKLTQIAAAAPADDAPLAAEATGLLAQLEAALPKPAAPPTPAPADPEEALLRAIADDPDDPSRRDALRAWIVAQGGERAEFVALQGRAQRGEALAPKEAKRLDALTGMAWKGWLGAIAPVVSELRFDRGLLVECTLAPKGTKTGAAVGDPRWATVETIHCAWSVRDKCNALVLHPALRGLRRLMGAPPELVEALFGDPAPRALEVIETQGMHPRLLPADLTAPGLARLREFSVGTWYRDDAVSKYTATWRPPSVLRPFLQSPFAARLALVHWHAHDTFVDDVAAELADHAPPSFRATVNLGFFSLSRGPDGRWGRVEVRIDSVDDALKYSNSALRTLLRLDPARATEVIVRVATGQDASRLDEQIAAARARFPKASVAVTSGEVRASG